MYGTRQKCFKKLCTYNKMNKQFESIQNENMTNSKNWCKGQTP